MEGELEKIERQQKITEIEGKNRKLKSEANEKNPEKNTKERKNSQEKEKGKIKEESNWEQI